MPFHGVADAKFLQTIECSNQMEHDNDGHLHSIVRSLPTNTKHFKITHLDIWQLSNIFGITDTHLKSGIADGEIEIEN